VEVDVSIRELFEDVQYMLGPARHVGSRYKFSTVFGNKEIVVEGVISNFIRSENGVHHYTATGRISTLITVTALLKRADQWEVVINTSKNFTQVLTGNFRLIK
jgi:hypothetical protein